MPRAMKEMRKWLSFFMSLVLLCANLPLSVLAEETIGNEAEQPLIAEKPVVEQPLETTEPVVEEAPANDPPVETEAPKTDAEAEVPKADVETEAPKTDVEESTSAEGKTPTVEEPVAETVDFALSVSKIDFKEIALGDELPDAETVRLTNTGTAELNVTLSETDDYDVSAENMTVPVGESTAICVQPKKDLMVGEHSETLTVSAGDVTRSVTLSFSVIETAQPADLLLNSAVAAVTMVPTGLTVSRNTYNSLCISWDMSGTAAGYKLYRSTSPNTGYVNVFTTSDPSVITYTDSTLTCGQAYYYRIAEIDASGTTGPMSGYRYGQPAPSQPQSFSISLVSTTSVRLKWARVEGATAYFIYRGDVQVATQAAVSGTVQSYTDTGLITGTNYTYYVRAVAYAGDNAVQGVPTESVIIQPLPPAPEGLKGEPLSHYQIKLTWKAVANVTGYRIYRSTTEGGMPTMIGQVQQTGSYTDALGLSAGADYYYSVASYVTDGDTTCESARSTVIKVSPVPAVNAITSVKPLDNNVIRVTWSAVDNVSGYELHVKNGGTFADDTDDGDEVFDVDAAQLSRDHNTGLTAGDRYYYRVRSYISVQGTKVYSAYSAIVTAYCTPLAPEKPVLTVMGYASLYLAWTDTTDAEHYQILRSTSATTGFRAIGTADVGTPEFMDNTVVCGTLYYYKIRAYRAANDATSSRIYSEFSPVIPGRAAPLAPASLTATSIAYNQIRLEWDATPGANGYVISRASLRADGTITSFAQIASITAAAAPLYIDRTAMVGTEYTYRVQAYRLVNGIQCTGAYSNTATAKTTPGTPTSLSVTVYNYKTLKLTWKAVPGVTAYNIYYKAKPYSDTSAPAFEDCTLLTSVMPNVLSYNATGLTIGKRYFFYLVSVVGAFEGEPSPVVTEVVRTVRSAVLTATSTSNNTITLNWRLIPGANGYFVYYNDTSANLSDVNWKLLNRVNTGDTTTYVDDSSLAVGDIRYYYVTAYATADGNDVESDKSPVATGVVLPTAPKNLTAINTAYNQIELNWDVVSACEGYEVLRSTSRLGVYMKACEINDPNDTSYTYNGGINGRFQHYRVRAYVEVGAVRYYGAYSYIAVQARPSAPLNVSGINANSIVNRVFWDVVPGATGYIVYYDTKPDGDFSNVAAHVTGGTTRATRHLNISIGTNYYYRVKAIRNASGITTYSDLSAVCGPVRAMPAKVTGVKATNMPNASINLTWSNCTGATGYRVTYMLSGSSASIETLYVDTNTATLTGLDYGETYDITVAATVTVNGIPESGPESDVLSRLCCPIAPTGLVAICTDATTVDLAWNTVTGIAGYILERSDDNGANYTVVVTINNPTQTEYTDTGLTTGKVYWYRVRATISGVEGLASAVSKVALVPAAPTVDVQVANKNALNLTWTAVSGAAGYEISRSTTRTGRYTVIARVLDPNTTYTNTRLTTGTVYYYRVRTYAINGTSYYYSPYSAIVAGMPGVDAPYLLRVTGTALSARIVWNTVAGAEGYTIYRATSAAGPYAKIITRANGAAVYTLDNKISVGTTYYYKVRAYCKVGSALKESAFSNAITFTPELGKVLNLKATSASTSSVKLTWTAVAGATGYDIYQVSASTGKSTCIASVGAVVTYTQYGLVLGTEYIYEVKAKKDTAAGAKSDQVIGTPLLPKPNKFTLTATTGTSQLTAGWEAVTGADGYRVLCRDPSTLRYTLIQTLNDSNLTSTVIDAYPDGTPFVVGDMPSIRVQAYFTKSDGSICVGQAASQITCEVK